MIWQMFANGAYPEVSEKTATKADLNWCEVDVTVGCGRASTATSVFATRKGLSAPMPHARFYRRGTTSFLPRLFAVSPGVQQFTSAPLLETEAVMAALCPHASGIGGLKLASRRRLHATHNSPSLFPGADIPGSRWGTLGGVRFLGKLRPISVRFDGHQWPEPTPRLYVAPSACPILSPVGLAWLQTRKLFK
jgi:hypothetical protein